ncbi:hypothetical protein BGZ99_002649 [Dissophora globulifera]|uniref:Aldose 1-epimerase n=1 Tax=Dissophora globulifera TaxID=979702 RepID=A0A9P6RQ87_9FUNG|nr:hypothetical protein BGZ99_002649 [Dissophora globulifera]
MPIKTTTLSTDPVLVQQHELSVSVDSTGRSASNTDRKVLSVTILTYGATLTHLTFPDRWGQPQDLTLGFDHWEDYLAQAESGAINPFFGAVIGRTASRIAHASFELEGNTHALKASNGVDCQHGGPLGFDKQHWSTISTTDDDGSGGPSVTLQLISPHGQNGYPGRLVTNVKWQLTSQGELALEYWAKLEAGTAAAGDTEIASQDLHSTIVSLTHHPYWNLDGVLNPPESQDLELLLSNSQQQQKDVEVRNPCSIKDHTLWIDSSTLVELGNPHAVPTGRLHNVSQKQPGDGESCLDFTLPTGTGKSLAAGLETIPGGYGYDHVYALAPPQETGIRSIAEVDIEGYYPATPHVANLASPRTGIRMELYTSEPALVLYAAGYLDHTMLPRTKSRHFDLPTSAFFISPTASPLPTHQEANTASHGPKSVVIAAEMGKFAGVCLEPIRYPDAIHHREWSNMVTLHQGQVYRQRTVYKFSSC